MSILKLIGEFLTAINSRYFYNSQRINIHADNQYSNHMQQ